MKILSLIFLILLMGCQTTLPYKPDNFQQLQDLHHSKGLVVFRVVSNGVYKGTIQKLIVKAKGRGQNSQFEIMAKSVTLPNETIVFTGWLEPGTYELIKIAGKYDEKSYSQDLKESPFFNVKPGYTNDLGIAYFLPTSKKRGSFFYHRNTKYITQNLVQKIVKGNPSKNLKHRYALARKPSTKKEIFNWRSNRTDKISGPFFSRSGDIAIGKRLGAITFNSGKTHKWEDLNIGIPVDINFIQIINSNYLLVVGGEGVSGIYNRKKKKFSAFPQKGLNGNVPLVAGYFDKKYWITATNGEDISVFNRTPNSKSWSKVTGETPKFFPKFTLSKPFFTEYKDGVLMLSDLNRNILAYDIASKSWERRKLPAFTQYITNQTDGLMAMSGDANYYSDDYGLTWKNINGRKKACVAASITGKTIYCKRKKSAILYTSNDFGKTWSSHIKGLHPSIENTSLELFAINGVPFYIDDQGIHTINADLDWKVLWASYRNLSEYSRSAGLSE